MPTIAICGAGPAGLTLARLLRLSADTNTPPSSSPSLQVTIFEKDSSPTSRFYQGGTLDLHTDTALAAIRAAGLWDEIQEWMRYEGEELIFADKNATEIIHIKHTPKIGNHDARPEIDREKLKEVLLQSVKPESIQWGKHVRQVNEGSGILTFADGTEAGPFNLVVGADGAWSKVRGTLSDVKPSYAGICGFEGNINSETAGKYWGELTKMVGRGSYFSFSDGRSLMGQMLGDGSMKISTWIQKEESWPADVIERTGGEPDKIRDVLLKEYQGWDDSMILLIKLADRFRPWPLYELPIGHRWEHKKGWTLIGDSAHLMTPFAGEGVNAAMRDALDLANAITEGVSTDASLDDCIKKYEQEMFPRAKKIQEDTAFNKEHMFAERAPMAYLTKMIGRVAGESGYDLSKGWLAWLGILPAIDVYFWLVARFGGLKRHIREWSRTKRVSS